MFIPDLAVAVALTTVITGLTAALVLERARRGDLAAKVAEQALVIVEQARRLAALERVDRNPLYRDSLEDQQARQLRAATDVATAVEFMTQALRTLSPEKLKKAKGAK